MNILAVDTSSDHGSIVVQVGGTVAAEVRRPSSLRNSEHVFESIGSVLAQARTTLESMDLFAAARGPGSFTGIRVGLAVMEGFAFSKGRPACGVSTLAALAWKVGPREAPIVPLLDARRGDIYAAVFRRRGEELIEVAAPAMLQPAEWFSTLPDGPLVFCGPGTSGCLERIQQCRAWTIVDVEPFLAGAIASLVEAGHREPPSPLYLRRTSAEMNLNALSTSDPAP